MHSRLLPLILLVFTVPALTAQTVPSFELNRDTYPALAAETLVQGDFNNDGKPDVIVGAGASPGAITLRLGNGDGTFKPPLSVGQADYAAPTDMAALDLNNDGNLDLVVVSENTFNSGTAGSVQVFFGNGDGRFQTPLSFTTANVPYSVAIGDFNGDGYLDLAIGEQENTVEVWNSIAGKAFVPAKKIVLGDFGNYVKVRTGNFDGDGIPSIAAMGFPGVFVLWNDGHENFTTANVYEDGYIDMAVADANQDGMDDILASGSENELIVNGQPQSPSNIVILYGQGNHKFFTQTAVQNWDMVGAYSIQAVDVNGDGIADLVASDDHYFPGTTSQQSIIGMYVWLGHPDGSYDQTPQVYRPTEGNVRGLIAGDWNRDGMMDFAMTLADDNEIEFLINGGSRAPCATSQINPTVTVCQPVNNTYLPAPAVTVQANAYDKNTVTAMQIYDNYSEVFSKDVSSFDTTLDLATGSHLLVVKAWDSTGLSFRSDRTITVYNGTPGPACPTTYQAASICLPATATSTSPVQVLANGWTANVPTAAQLYVDGDLAVNNQACNSSGSDCDGGTSFLNTTQTLPSGSHDLVFKLWDNLGNVYEAQKTVTVQ